jgi:serine O-acetyltransferase
MVVNPGTIIGNNVNLSQFLNIGTNHDTPAIIGDYVYIGPHVCIVEDVKIDNGSTIGAGAVVTKDIPENATAAGVPAKVLNYNDPERYIINKWEF